MYRGDSNLQVKYYTYSEGYYVSLFIYLFEMK